MSKINFISLRAIELIDNFSPSQIGIYFSLLFHLLILLFAIGLQDFFEPKPIPLPNIIPIEIINISKNTSLIKKNIAKDTDAQKIKLIEQKKFNSSKSNEIQKIELQEKPKVNKKIQTNDLKIKEKKIQTNDLKIKEKKIQTNEIPQNNKTTITKKSNNDNNVETIKQKKIKPKLKPKPKEMVQDKSDMILEKNTIIQKPKEIQKDIKVPPPPMPKPEPDFSLASMLKDLRNEQSNNIIEKEDLNEEQQIAKNDEKKNNEEANLSISEIDLLRQQLSSCWIAPAGAVIEKGMKVTISAKVQQNRKVVESSVRIVDTNIAKSNAFYGPITESAMRTLLNPDCKPLKLPVEKYYLWKNLTITFDYSIMKGYS